MGTRAPRAPSCAALVFYRSASPPPPWWGGRDNFVLMLVLCQRRHSLMLVAMVTFTLCFAALLAVFLAFPQHCLTIYNPLQRDNLPRQAGAPRAGLSTSVPANVHANGQTALCFAALLAVFLAFPQHCLTIYNPLQRDNLPRQA